VVIVRVTVSVIKADIGSVGGHTLPSPEVHGMVKEYVDRKGVGMLLDSHVCHTGDDICLIMTHTHGVNHPSVHALAWEAFRAGTAIPGLLLSERCTTGSGSGSWTWITPKATGR
jgi:fructose 1,6-bisphosphate aldolase/phosphatase